MATRTKTKAAINLKSAPSQPLVTISDSVKRPDSIVLIRVDTNGSFTAPVNKLFSLLIYFSQNPQLLEPVPPPSPGIDSPESYMWVSTTHIAKALGIKKNVLEEIRKYLLVLAEANIESASLRSIESKRFISGHVVMMGAGSSPSKIGFSFPEANKVTIQNPEIYTRLSLNKVLGFQNQPDMVLYQVAMRYMTSPGGLSVKRPWTYWYETLTANTVGSAAVFKEKHGQAAYRIFKRDTMVPAMAGVSYRGINVDCLEHYSAEDVDIQFAVQKIIWVDNKQEPSNWHLIDDDAESEEVQEAASNLRGDISDTLGISELQLDKLFKTFDLNKIYRNFKYMTEKVKTEKSKPAGYLYKACADDYAAEKAQTNRADIKTTEAASVKKLLLGKNTAESRAALLKALKTADKKVELTESALKKREPKSESEFGTNFFKSIMKSFCAQIVIESDDEISDVIDVDAIEVEVAPARLSKARRTSAKKVTSKPEPKPELEQTADGGGADEVKPVRKRRVSAAKKVIEEAKPTTPSSPAINAATAAQEALLALSKGKAPEERKVANPEDSNGGEKEEGIDPAVSKFMQAKEAAERKASTAKKSEIETNRSHFETLPKAIQEQLLLKFKEQNPRLRWREGMTGPASFSFFGNFMGQALESMR